MMVGIKNILSLILITSIMFLLVSCGEGEVEIVDIFSEEVGSNADLSEDYIEADSQIADELNTEEAEPEQEEIEEVEALECEDNSDCEWNEYCIDNECGQITDVYDTSGDCEKLCNFDNVLITTSDGEELTLSRGKGSYTSAGALEWKLLSSADYCLGEGATPVAIELIKKNLGAIVEEEVILLELGEESETITHPDLASVSFTLTAESYDETCSVQ